MICKGHAKSLAYHPWGVVYCTTLMTMWNYSASSASDPGTADISPGGVIDIVAKNCGTYPVIVNGMTMEPQEVFTFSDVANGGAFFQVYPVNPGEHSTVCFIAHSKRPYYQEVYVVGSVVGVPAPLDVKVVEE